MLRWRLPIGIVLIASLIALFALDVRIGYSAPLLCVFTVLLAIRAAWELVQLLKTRSFAPSFLLTSICCTVVVASNWIPWCLAKFAGIGFGVTLFPNDKLNQAQPMATSACGETLAVLSIAFAMCALLMIVAAAARYRTPGASMETLGGEIFILTYVGLFLSLTAQLRWVGFASGIFMADLGYLPLASVIVVTKCGDTLAYTFGHLFGKKKLAPLLSPGKTWAGAYGALIGAAAGSWAWLYWGTKWLAPAVQPGEWYWAVLYGLVIGIAGMVGDLCESLIKRDVGVKDSAPLLPGFGGVLDLLDSVIFAGPVAYLLWLVLPLVRQ